MAQKKPSKKPAAAKRPPPPPAPPAKREKGDWQCEGCGAWNKHYVITKCFECWHERKNPPLQRYPAKRKVIDI